MMVLLQNAKLTEAACVHLPVGLRDHLMLTYGSQHDRTDARVLVVLLQHWRHASLCCPSLPHHHYHHQLQQHCDGMSVISRELALRVALAFISAVRFNTLQFLNVLHLTAFYTGQSVKRRVTGRIPGF